MKLKMFDMHRPTLARQLRSMLDDKVSDFDVGWDIIPSYSGSVVFRATHQAFGILECVTQEDPRSMSDADEAYCTWCWME